MSNNAPTSQKRNPRNGVQPKYLLLCVDSAGCDWLWRTTDDMVLTVDETELVQARELPADASPEALLAQIDSDIGIARRYLAGSMAGALAQGLDA